jgi:glycosyltransferase involved in cell wall biosynthesis
VPEAGRPRLIDGVDAMKIILFANTDWYLYNFRLALASALRESGAEVVLLCPPGPYVARLQQAGFRVRLLAMDRLSLQPLREGLLVRRIWRIYRDEKPDLVHHFTIKPVVYGSLAARLARVPACINAIAGLGHVFARDGMGNAALRPIVSGLLRRALRGDGSRLIVQNRADHFALLDRAIVSRDRIRLIRGSGVDCNRFCPPPLTPVRTKDFRVVLATRLLWDKGVADFVTAARILRNEGFGIRFLLAGAPDRGNPGAVAETVIAGWRSEGLIEVLGHVDDMATMLAQVDAVVLPTTYGEGVPRILLEGAASGLPCIASDTAGCREIIKHGETGLLVRPRDVESLAAAIRRLHHEPALRLRLGAAARRLAVREFDERLVIGQTLGVYREVARLPEMRGFLPTAAQQAGSA